MLLRKIRLLDGDGIFEAAVIWETGDDWTVRILDPERCDPQAYLPGTKVFHGGWLRISKKDLGAELIDDTFDTATLHPMPRGIVEAYVLRNSSPPDSLFHQIRDALEELCRIGAQHPDGGPVSYVLERCDRIPHNGMDIVAAGILRDASGFAGDEARLNGAGLKLFTTIEQDDGVPTLYMRIGGDQAHNYPAFVADGKAMLGRRGLLRTN